MYWNIHFQVYSTAFSIHIVVIVLLFNYFHIACEKQSSSSSSLSSSAPPKLLVISFDGFRWDYIDKFDTPMFDFVAHTGVHAKIGLRTAFITKTFPTHWTIATGLYEESHGIIDNKFYDPEFREVFNKTLLDAKWYGGEPVWNTAKKQGKKVGIYFWPGSEIKVNGMYADYYMRFDLETPFQEEVDTIINWLKNDEVDFAMAYFNQPDRAGHRYGTFSHAVQNAVRTVDNLLKYIIEQLEHFQLYQKTNILLVSDHGMANFTDPNERQIILNNYIDLENDVISVPQLGSLAGIIPREGKLMKVYNKLKGAHPNLTVYLKEEIPEKFHYKHNRRVTPIVCLADQGFEIVKTRETIVDAASHGFNNELITMNPIFFARGPDFKKNVSTDIFETVNIYPLMCHLLHIKPAMNNGSIENVRHILTDASQKRIVKNSTRAIIGDFKVLCVLIIFTSFISFTIFI